MDLRLMTVIVLSTLLIDVDESRVILNGTIEKGMKTEEPITDQLYSSNTSPPTKSSTSGTSLDAVPSYGYVEGTKTPRSFFQINNDRLVGGSYAVINVLLNGPPMNFADDALDAESSAVMAEDTTPSNKDMTTYYKQMKNKMDSSAANSTTQVNRLTKYPTTLKPRMVRTSTTTIRPLQHYKYQSTTVNSTRLNIENNLTKTLTSDVFIEHPTSHSSLNESTKRLSNNRKSNHHITVADQIIGQTTTLKHTNLIMHVSTTMTPMTMKTTLSPDPMATYTSTMRPVVPPQTVVYRGSTLSSIPANYNSVSISVVGSNEPIVKSNVYSVKATVYAELLTNDTNVIQKPYQGQNNDQRYGVTDILTIANSIQDNGTAKTAELAKHSFDNFKPSTMSPLPKANNHPKVTPRHFRSESVVDENQKRTRKKTGVPTTQRVISNASVADGFQYIPRPATQMVTPFPHSKPLFRVLQDKTPFSTSTGYRTYGRIPSSSSQADPYLQNKRQPRIHTDEIRKRSHPITYIQRSYGPLGLVNRHRGTPVRQFSYPNKISYHHFRPQYQSNNNAYRIPYRRFQGPTYRNFMNPSKGFLPQQQLQNNAKPNYLGIMHNSGYTQGTFVRSNVEHLFIDSRYSSQNVPYYQLYLQHKTYGSRGVSRNSSPINWWSLFEDLFEL